jgi:predicted nuclease with TOPRIM domain
VPLSDEAIREKVIRHDYEFKALSENLNNVVKELHELTSSLKNIGVINEKIENMDQNLRESFNRVHKRVDKNELEIKEVHKIQDNQHECKNQIDTLNRAVYGKDGRGGLLFDVEDIKKFMYKSMGFFTLLNIVLGIIVSYMLK